MGLYLDFCVDPALTQTWTGVLQSLVGAAFSTLGSGGLSRLKQLDSGAVTASGESLEDLFHKYDADESGTVDKAELTAMMHELGHDVPGEELDALIARTPGGYVPTEEMLEAGDYRMDGGELGNIFEPGCQEVARSLGWEPVDAYTHRDDHPDPQKAGKPTGATMWVRRPPKSPPPSLGAGRATRAPRDDGGGEAPAPGVGAPARVVHTYQIFHNKMEEN